jgi:hypothetical protein
MALAVLSGRIASMLLHSQLLGTHDSYDGQGMTIQELLDLLKSVPPKARHNYVMVSHGDAPPEDVTGLHFAQSDQAEKWEFKVYIVAQKSRTANEQPPGPPASAGGQQKTET